LVLPPLPDSDLDSDAEAGFVEVQFAGTTSVADPRTYKQAMQGPDAVKWHKAAQDEFISLESNGTWELVDLPPGAKAIGSGWVFKVKHNADGSVECYKTCLVAKGFSQRPGIDYNEVFAPTFRPAALRLILALAGIEDMELRSVDVTSAFPNGDLEEVIYMRQPEGFVQDGQNKVLRLKKSLYSLKQSARQWNKKLHKVLMDMGFTRLESDRSIYIYVKGDVKIIVPIYIDDITFASKSKSAIDETVAEFSKHFKIRDLGDTKFLLGVEVIRDHKNRTIALSQRQYIIDMLERYRMSDCNPVQTPMQPGLKLSKSMCSQASEEAQEMENVPYLNAVGSLQYLATMTRPDIAYAVSCLARFCCMSN